MLQRISVWAMSTPSLRRLAWRTGRRLYSIGRGEEQQPDNFSVNGEGYVQECVIKAMPASGEVAIVDIGANRGDWTASLLALIPPARLSVGALRIEVFEPAPLVFQKLRSRIASLDKAGIVKLHAIALSDALGVAQMAIMSEHGGTNSLSFDAETGRQAVEVVEVGKSTLTEFCAAAKIGHVTLAKSDTEGHDLQALRGARDLLAGGRIDVFQFEYNHRWIFAHAFLKDVFDLVDGLPYWVARIQRRSLDVFESWHPELDRFFQSNYVLVRDGALGWFDTRICKFDESNTYG